MVHKIESEHMTFPLSIDLATRRAILYKQKTDASREEYGAPAARRSRESRCRLRNHGRRWCCWTCVVCARGISALFMSCECSRAQSICIASWCCSTRATTKMPPATQRACTAFVLPGTMWLTWGGAARTASSDSSSKDPLRRRPAPPSRLRGIDGGERSREGRVVAARGREEQALKALRDGAGLAVADRQAIDGNDWGDLFRRPADQDLIAHVELGAIDRALDRRATVLASVELEHGPPRDRFEHTVGYGRDDEVALTHHHESGAGGFRDLSALRQQDRVVESVLTRFDGGETIVLVVRPRLHARGHHVIRDAAPRRHTHAQAPLELVVVGARAAQDKGASVDLVGPIRLHAARAAVAEVGHEPEVDVVVKVVGPEPLDHGRAQFVERVGQLHSHHLHAVAEPAQVLVELPDVEVLPGGTPVCAQPFVHVRAPQHGEREDAERRVLGRNDFAVEPDLVMLVTGHACPPLVRPSVSSQRVAVPRGLVATCAPSGRRLTALRRLPDNSRRCPPG